MPGIASTVDAISFGPFHLLPAQQLLLEGEVPVRLGSRALEILIALVEREGQLVSKSELMARVWPDTFVEECNLKVHIAALRKTLGDGRPGRRYLATIPGRGYRFVAPIERSRQGPPLAPSGAIALTQTHLLPARQIRAIGRDDTVSALVTQLLRRQLITIVGPGGIGKTTVALSVAQTVAASYRHGVRFVELAPLADAQSVPNAIASGIGLAIHSDNIVPGLIAHLQDKRMLLVLDSCEHVIDVAASLAERIQDGAPGVQILATSRELLRARGERVHRLCPLELPPESQALTASQALAFPSVQLFVEHAAANLDGFELNDAEAPIVAEICRKLAGIPLAIELAATRVDAFGLRQLSILLDDRMRLLKYGKRTALRRHQTLSAALDWSYQFLPEDERVLLRRLSIFSCSGFTLDSARAVAADGNPDFAEGIADLVAKSLLAADIRGEIVRYRLLDTTRAYALQKLSDAGELADTAKHHAEHFKAALELATVEWDRLSSVEWLARYAPYIDDIRAALDWAHSSNGDPETGVALATAAIPLWFELWLLDECRMRTEQALRIVEREGGKDHDQRMRLHAGLALAQAYTSQSIRDTRANWVTALEIAQARNNTEYQLRALWGLWGTHVNRGEIKDAIAIATRFSQLATAKSDTNDQLVGDRIAGAALHFLGDQQKARTHIERMLAFYVPPTSRSNTVRFQSDQRLMAQMYFARILWLQGEVDRARQLSEANVEDARATRQPQSLCYALTGAACPIALSVGDIETAERYVSLLLDLTTRESLEIWHAHAICIEGQLHLRRGEVGRGLEKLEAGIDRMTSAEFNQYLVSFLGLFALGLATINNVSRALAIVDGALDRAERDAAKWYYPELLRVKGSILSKTETAAGIEKAQEQFLVSLEVARQQTALAWELRTSTSLARLWQSQGRVGDAHAMLRSVCDRFTEGRETPDLRDAATLLEELAPGWHE